MSNHLIILLGGTGCAVGRQLTKRLNRRWLDNGNHGERPGVFEFSEKINQQKVTSRIATLSIYSNVEDLNDNGQDWMERSSMSGLGDEEKVQINPILNSEGTPWITGHEEQILTAVHRQLTRLEEMYVGAAVHIVSHLAGNGSMTNLVLLLQKELKHRGIAHYPIMLHGFVSARQNPYSTEHFYARQYATIRELNSIRLIGHCQENTFDRTCPNTHPYAINFSPSKTTRISVDPRNSFQSMALISESTRTGKLFSISEQVETVAEFLFQVSVNHMDGLPRRLSDAITMNPFLQSLVDESSNEEQATCFLSYGVQKLAYPVQDIHDKIGLVLGHQFLLRILFGWGHNEKRPFNVDEEVRNRRFLWKLDRDHLVLDVVEKSQPYFDEWTLAARNRHAAVLASEGKARSDQWLAEFDKSMHEFTEKHFREVGVERYFNHRCDDVEIRKTAVDLRHKIEQCLLTEFEAANSKLPIAAMLDMLDQLKADLDADCGNLYDQLTAIGARYLAHLRHQRENLASQFERCGWIMEVLGKKRMALFEQYVENTIEQRFWETKARGIAFALKLTPVLCIELESLRCTMAELFATLNALATSCAIEASRLIPIPGHKSTKRDEEVVNASEINRIITDRFKDNAEMHDWAAPRIMDSLVGLFGGGRTFASYLHRTSTNKRGMDGGGLAHALLKASSAAALQAHYLEIANSNGTIPDILDVNIMRRLASEYTGKVSDLKPWLQELFDKGAPLIAFDSSELPMNTDGSGLVAAPRLLRYVFIPECPGLDPSFQNDFVRLVGAMSGPFSPFVNEENIVGVTPGHCHPSEIVILSISYFFSPRCTTTVNMLKKKFSN